MGGEGGSRELAVLGHLSVCVHDAEIFMRLLRTVQQQMMSGSNRLPVSMATSAILHPLAPLLSLVRRDGDSSGGYLLTTRRQIRENEVRKGRGERKKKIRIIDEGKLKIKGILGNIFVIVH